MEVSDYRRALRAFADWLDDANVGPAIAKKLTELGLYIDPCWHDEDGNDVGVKVPSDTDPSKLFLGADEMAKRLSQS